MVMIIIMTGFLLLSMKIMMRMIMMMMVIIHMIMKILIAIMIAARGIYYTNMIILYCHQDLHAQGNKDKGIVLKILSKIIFTILIRTKIDSIPPIIKEFD